MGLFGGGNSSTTNNADSRAYVDNSVVDFGIGGGNKYNGGNSYGDVKASGNIAISTTDFGALQSAETIAGTALSVVDNSVLSLKDGFNSSLSSLNKISSNSIKAVKDSYQSDNKSISKNVIMWGSIVALGYLALKLKG